MTGSFEIHESELLFEAGKALEEAIEGGESDTSVGTNASEIELAVRRGPIPAGPICGLTPNPTRQVEKPFLPAVDASMEAVRRYILYALMHDYGYSEEGAQSVANRWRHGRGAVFRGITLENLEHIFQEADGRCLHKVMTLDAEEEQRRQEQKAVDTWNHGDRQIGYTGRIVELVAEFLSLANMAQFVSPSAASLRLSFLFLPRNVS